MKEVIGVIPARFKSSRYPGKPLVILNGIPMIIRVCKIVEKALGKQNTYVATDDYRIKKEVEKYGYKVVMTSENCLTGTDRIWDFAQRVKAKIYINVQGDEPLLDPNDIIEIVRVKKDNMSAVINGMCPVSENENPENINLPKVLVTKSNDLIYMSRLPIPGIKSLHFSERPTYKKQVCIYGFSFGDLEAFGKQRHKAEYEKYEDIEILRFFDLGIPIKMVEMSGSSLAVDIPSDVNAVEEILLKADTYYD